jgi:hypothetical protein
MILHIHHIKNSYFALPLEKQAELTAATLAFRNKYLKNDKMKACYAISDGKGFVSIWDVASAEETMFANLEYPLAPYIESEIYGWTPAKHYREKQNLKS